MILTILLLLVVPADIKAQTRTHLQALQSVSAVESIGKYAYPVAIFNNRQQTERPPHFHGPYIKDTWAELLRESLFWHYEPSGDHFTFKDLCTWEENGRQIIPCAGELYANSLDISRIIVKYETKKWGVVELAVNYDFVSLSEPRLVAKTGTLRWADKETRVTWSNYREFHGDQPVVKEWSDDETVRAQGQRDAAQNVQRSPANDGQVDGTRRPDSADQDLNLRSGEAQITPVPKAQEITLENLLTPSQGETQTVKIKSRWWRIFRK